MFFFSLPFFEGGLKVDQAFRNCNLSFDIFSTMFALVMPSMNFIFFLIKRNNSILTMAINIQT